MPQNRTSRRIPRLRVGNRVRFSFAGKRIRAVVIEDRGNIGVGGRQLVAIKMKESGYGDAGERIFEMPAEDLTVLK
jgi:hypothetical protein